MADLADPKLILFFPTNARVVLLGIRSTIRQDPHSLRKSRRSSLGAELA